MSIQHLSHLAADVNPDRVETQTSVEEPCEVMSSAAFVRLVTGWVTCAKGGISDPGNWRIDYVVKMIRMRRRVFELALRKP